MDNNLQKGTKRDERTKKWKYGDHQMFITSPNVPVCQAMKDKTKLVRERSSRRIAEWFRDAVLDRPKLQNLSLTYYVE